jgi:predicted nucleotidyltransferase
VRLHLPSALMNSSLSPLSTYVCARPGRAGRLNCYGEIDMSGIGNDVQRTLADWAARNPKVRRVWVFGSRARGTHRPDDDIDIAVELEPVADSEETLLVWLANSEKWRSQLQDKISLPVDLEWFDPNGGTGTIRAALDQAKTLVYEAAI